MAEEQFSEICRDYGLVAIGGDLTPDRLLSAYRQGVFPWFDEATPILWWSPDPRAIFEIESFQPSRRLWRTYRSGKFHITVDLNYVDVMKGCAVRPGEGTWITQEMLDAYTELHRLGFAHSVETWEGEELVGGVYGVAIGGFFAGESMFHRRRDASKVALVYLMERLKQRGYVLFDTQFLTEHTASLGAIEIPRADYLRRLQVALRQPTSFG